jgi:hypothetical protein
VQVAGAAWKATTRIVAGVGDLVQRIEDGRTGEYSVAGRSRGRVAPCAVCTVHVETRSACFLVEPQNHGRRFINDLASKPAGWFSPVWPQNRCDGFLRFCLKTSGDGILVEHQNQGGGGFPGLGLKTGSYGLVILASKSPWLFWFGPQNQAGFGLSVASQNR